MVAIDVLVSTHTPQDSPSPKFQRNVYLDNKALLTQIEKWNHQGPPAGTLALEYDLLTTGRNDHCHQIWYHSHYSP